MFSTGGAHKKPSSSCSMALFDDKHRANASNKGSFGLVSSQGKGAFTWPSEQEVTLARSAQRH